MLTLDRTTFTYYALPDDATAVIHDLVALMDSARISLDLEMYGFTDLLLAAAIERAKVRGVAVQVIADRLSSAGPKQKSLLARLASAIGGQNILRGTSDKRQFDHRKALVVDAEANVPDAYYASWQEARADGYPCVAFGSTNWTAVSRAQNNDLVIMPSKAMAAEFLTLFQQHWAWVAANEQAYQEAA